MNYEELLYRLIKEDERIVILTAENRAAIRNLPDKISDKFIDVGIAEQTMVGMAAGLALRGRIPVVHALATFLTMRAFEFIRTDIGIGDLPVKLIGAVPGFLSDGNGPTHQAIEDISLMRTIPPMNVFCPSDEDDMLLGLKDVLLYPSPFYVRYNNSRPPVEHKKEFRIGKAEVISEGRDIMILTYGILLRQAIEAADILRTEGRSVGIINMRTLKPIDEEIIKKICRRDILLVTLEDHFITGGLYSILSELLVKYRLRCNVLPIALENKWFKPAMLAEVLDYEGFSAEKIAGRINKELIRLSESKVYTI